MREQRNSQEENEDKEDQASDHQPDGADLFLRQCRLA
jgi:hypothetical protein